MGPPQEAPEVRGKLGAQGLGAVGATTALLPQHHGHSQKASRQNHVHGR